MGIKIEGYIIKNEHVINDDFYKTGIHRMEYIHVNFTRLEDPKT